MAYKTEIQIGVKGTAQLDKLRQQISSLNNKVNQIDEAFGRGVQSVKRYEENLRKAADTLRKAKMATDDEERAVKQYVTALNNANAAQQRQNSLIEKEITRRGQATQALRKYNAELAGPRQPGSMAGSYLRGGGVGRTGVPTGGSSQYPSPIGPQPDAAAAFMKRTEAAAQAAKRLTAEFIVNQRAARQLAEEQRRINSAEFIARTDAAAKAAHRQNAELAKRIRLRKQLENLLPKAKDTPGQYPLPIGPLPAGAKGAGKGKGLLDQISAFGLGAGFPLLFGGGAGQVLGGALGTALGGSDPAAFGLQIAFSAIGGKIEEAAIRVRELDKAIQNLDLSALADSTLLVNAELRESIQNFIDLGQSQKAVELLAKETLLQTGLLPESIRDSARATLRLSNAWDESVGAASGLLAMLSTDLIDTLGLSLRIINQGVKGINTLVSNARRIGRGGSDSPKTPDSIGSFVGFVGQKFISEATQTLPGVREFRQATTFLAKILGLTNEIDEAAEKRVFDLKQSSKELQKEVALDTQLLEIEQRRVAGTNAAAKLNNAQVTRAVALKELEIATEKAIVDKRREYGNVNDKVLETLRDQDISLIRQKELNAKARIDKEFALAKEAADQLKLKEIEKERKETEKEVLEIRRQQAKIGEARIQTQLNELANEQKIFQIRQQTAAASIQLDRVRAEAQLSLLRLQESRLQRELSSLQKLNTNFERQRDLIDKIAANRAKQAKVENQVAKAQAQQGIRQAIIAQQQIKFQVQRIKLELQLQKIKAQGEKDDNVRLQQLKAINSIEAQNNKLIEVMVKESNKQVGIAREIANEQRKIADNILKGKLESIEAERVEARRAANAKELAKATGQAADEAARLARNSSSGTGRTTTPGASTSMKIDPDVYKSVIDNAPAFGYKNTYELAAALDKAQQVKNAQTAKAAQMSQPSATSYSPTYNTGTALAATPLTSTVNVSTGPVMQFDDRRYVSMEDFESGLRLASSINVAYGRSYAGRRYGGII